MVSVSTTLNDFAKSMLEYSVIFLSLYFISCNYFAVVFVNFVLFVPPSLSSSPDRAGALLYGQSA